MLSPFTLRGELAQLEPLRSEHTAALAAAAATDRASFGFTWVPAGRRDAERYVQAALDHQAAGRAVVLTVRSRLDDAIVGSTRFLDLEVFTWPPPWPPGVASGLLPSDSQFPSVAEIGSTWYAASAQGTGINREVKLLQLTHAFECWGVLRVSFKTDARNRRSRAAIEQVGAAFEGVRRAHAPANDGTVRDTAYYSITAVDWPKVRDCLQARLRRGTSE